MPPHGNCVCNWHVIYTYVSAPPEFCFAQTTMAINLEYQDYDYFFAGLANFGWIAGSGIAGGAVSGAAYNPVVGTVLAMSQVFIDINIARSHRDFRLVCTRALRRTNTCTYTYTYTYTYTHTHTNMRTGFYSRHLDLLSGAEPWWYVGRISFPLHRGSPEDR